MAVVLVVSALVLCAVVTVIGGSVVVSSIVVTVFGGSVVVSSVGVASVVGVDELVETVEAVTLEVDTGASAVEDEVDPLASGPLTLSPNVVSFALVELCGDDSAGRDEPDVAASSLLEHAVKISASEMINVLTVCRRVICPD